MGRYLDLARAAQRHAPAPELPDPRPDLVEDSHLWRRLLAASREAGGSGADSLLATLLALRSCGGRLVAGANGFHVESGDDGEAERLAGHRPHAYYRDRFLIPHRDLLVGLLLVLGSQDP